MVDLNARVRELHAQLDGFCDGEPGWAQMFVFPRTEEDGPSFCYTMGLSEKGMPDLIVFGLPRETSQVLMHNIVEDVVKPRYQWADKAPLIDGEVIEHDNWPFPFSVRTVSASKVEMSAAERRARLAGCSVEAVQIVWPDPNGKFPWDEGFSERLRKSQPAHWGGEAATA